MLYGVTSGCNSLQELCGGIINYGAKKVNFDNLGQGLPIHLIEPKTAHYKNIASQTQQFLLIILEVLIKTT